jgi:hypothetical protein
MMTVEEACQKAAEYISETPYRSDDAEHEIAELLFALESIAQRKVTR